MTAKKKVESSPLSKTKQKKSRVSPKISKPDMKFVKYEDLNDGDAFLMDGQLWMKYELENQVAVCLDESGNFEIDLCDFIIEPVDIQITWKRKG